MRSDSGFESGDTVSQYYDNLVAKIVVWGHDRDAARRRLLRAVSEMEVEGVATTRAVIQAVLTHDDFIEARHSTRWLEERLDLSDIAAVPPAGGPPHEAGSTRDTGSTDGVEDMVIREVDAEVDGRRYRVKLWVPDTAATGQPAPRSKRTPASSRRRAAAATGARRRRDGQCPDAGDDHQGPRDRGRARRGQPDHMCAGGHEDGEPDLRGPGGDGERAPRLGRRLARRRRRRGGHRLTQVTTTETAKQAGPHHDRGRRRPADRPLADDPRPPGARLRRGAGVEVVRRGAQRRRLHRRAGNLRVGDRVRCECRDRAAHGRDMRRVRRPSRDRPCLRSQRDRLGGRRRRPRSGPARGRPRHHRPRPRHAGGGRRRRQDPHDAARRFRRRQRRAHGAPVAERARSHAVPRREPLRRPLHRQGGARFGVPRAGCQRRRRDHRRPGRDRAAAPALGPRRSGPRDRHLRRCCPEHRARARRGEVLRARRDPGSPGGRGRRES